MKSGGPNCMLRRGDSLPSSILCWEEDPGFDRLANNLVRFSSVR